MTRADLAAYEIEWYAVGLASSAKQRRAGASSKQRKGKKQRAGKRTRDRFALTPTAASADRHAADLLSMINCQPARAAAFYEALPRWVEFLADRGLIPEADAGTLVRQLMQRLADCADVLDEVTADRMVLANVREVQARYSTEAGP